LDPSRQFVVRGGANNVPVRPLRKGVEAMIALLSEVFAVAAVCWGFGATAAILALCILNAEAGR
jgi:hypothetical protein